MREVGKGSWYVGDRGVLPLVQWHVPLQTAMHYWGKYNKNTDKNITNGKDELEMKGPHEQERWRSCERPRGTPQRVERRQASRRGYPHRATSESPDSNLALSETTMCKYEEALYEWKWRRKREGEREERKELQGGGYSPALARQGGSWMVSIWQSHRG